MAGWRTFSDSDGDEPLKKSVKSKLAPPLPQCTVLILTVDPPERTHFQLNSLYEKMKNVLREISCGIINAFHLDDVVAPVYELIKAVNMLCTQKDAHRLVALLEL